jgi:hypothetical protein
MYSPQRNGGNGELQLSISGDAEIDNVPIACGEGYKLSRYTQLNYNRFMDISSLLDINARRA